VPEPAPDRNESADQSEAAYALLDDQPVIDSSKDCLGSVNTSRKLADILRSSISSGQPSPFVMAIDAPWGRGKSTLLMNMYAQLESDKKRGRRNSRDNHPIRCVQFNAWTAEKSSVLDTLITTVVSELDANFARRWANRLARQRGLLSALRVSFSIIAGFFGFSRAVDAFMASLSIRTRTREQIRDSIHLVLADWLKGTGPSSTDRALVVFVDDLDRCSNETILQMCETIKLYLDVPGLIFVLACDLLILWRGVATAARFQHRQASAYLEKIIQVSYQVPRPDENQIAALIRQCALHSGTSGLIDDPVSVALAERTKRNPRRIKRIINSFILQYALDPEWAKPELGPANLIKAVLLYQLYPSFYDIFIGDYSSDDPIGDFLDYVELTNRPDDWQSLAEKILTAYHSDMQAKIIEEALGKMKEILPEALPELARDNELISLLRSMGEIETRTAIRSRLRRSPLQTERLLDSLHALTEQLNAQVLTTELAAATEQAQYQELMIEADANNAAASSVAQAAQRKMQTNTKLMRAFDQILSDRSD
jgi:KAP family P-loop domain